MSTGKRGGDDRLVWSSERGGSTPPIARSPRSRPRDTALDRNDGVVRVRRELAGRRGKPVTTVHGLPLDAAELKGLAGELKRRCGSGGSAKDGVIEIQGDHRDVIVAELEARGYTVKLAGG